MSRQATFEIYINGHRSGEKISPATLDVNEWIDALTQGRNLLFPETNKKKLPKLSVSVEEGSVAFLFHTSVQAVVATQALLKEVQNTGDLAILPTKQIEAIQYFNKLARDNKWEISLAENKKRGQGLQLTPKTKFQDEETAWVEVETFVWGTIVNIGGKTQPNIHLETEDFGKLIVNAKQEALAQEEKNRLYQRHQLQISIRQNAHTGEYDAKSARLVAFVDHNWDESPDDYLNRLINAATPQLSAIRDKDVWLKEIRGYED